MDNNSSNDKITIEDIMEIEVKSFFQLAGKRKKITLTFLAFVVFSMIFGYTLGNNVEALGAYRFLISPLVSMILIRQCLFLADRDPEKQIRSDQVFSFILYYVIIGCFGFIMKMVFLFAVDTRSTVALLQSKSTILDVDKMIQQLIMTENIAVVSIITLIIVVITIVLDILYGMAPIIILESSGKISIMTALKLSRKIMENNVKSMAILILRLIPKFFVCMLTFGIALFYYVPYFLMLDVNFYALARQKYCTRT